MFRFILQREDIHVSPCLSVSPFIRVSDRLSAQRNCNRKLEMSTAPQGGWCVECNRRQVCGGRVRLPVFFFLFHSFSICICLYQSVFVRLCIPAWLFCLMFIGFSIQLQYLPYFIHSGFVHFLPFSFLFSFFSYFIIFIFLHLFAFVSFSFNICMFLRSILPA